MRFPIISELRTFVLLIALLAFAIHWVLGIGWALPVYAFFCVGVLISRQHRREILAAPLAVCAPVDGVVLAIDNSLKHEFMPELTVIRIRIQQALVGEYVLHSPIEGRVLERWWPDKIINKPGGSNSFGFLIQADEGDLCVVDITQPYFKTHLVASGQRARQGQRIGMVGINVIVDVYVAENSVVTVEAGQRVQAGADKLAKLKRHY